jgi:hypothetical protein
MASKGSGMFSGLTGNEGIHLANMLTSGASHLVPDSASGDRGDHWDLVMELCDLGDEAYGDTHPRGEGNGR